MKVKLTLEEYLFCITYCALRREFKALRLLLDFTIPGRIELGRQMGSGGTNAVYEVKGNSLWLLKNAGASSGKSREYQAMVKMSAIGLDTVSPSLFEFNGPQNNTTMILMKRVLNGIDSKSIIGYKRDLKNYIDPDMKFPCPNQNAIFITDNTLQELIYGFTKIVGKNTDFGDYQFMLDSNGHVYHNDPTEQLKYKKGSSTQVIIQAIIDTWEYTNLPLARGMSWSKFKKLKVALRKHRQTLFFRTVRDKKARGPSFCILSYDAIDWQGMSIYCLYESVNRCKISNWRCCKFKGKYYYMPMETLPKQRLILGSSHYIQSIVPEDVVEHFIDTLKRQKK